MRWLVERYSKVSWMMVPIAAYLAITLLLPLVNGAAIRGNFIHHAGWVVIGCVAVVSIAVIGGVIIELAFGGARRLVHYLGGRS